MAADGQVVHEDVDLGFAQLCDHLGSARLALVGEHEGTVLVGIFQHVLGNAVEPASHGHDGTGRLHVLLEDRRAIRLGENRLGDVAPDLAAVDVPGGGDMDVGGSIAADLGVEQTGEIVRALTVIG